MILLMHVNFSKKKTKDTLINIGSGNENTILGFANFIMRKMNVNLKIDFDKSKPNGTPRKILNTKLANLMVGNLKLIYQKVLI